MDDLTQLPSDYLLRLPIDELENLCMVNKYMYNQCNNNSFWRTKFTIDNVPLVFEGNTIREWVDEYLINKDIFENQYPNLQFHYSLDLSKVDNIFTLFDKNLSSEIIEIFSENLYTYSTLEVYIKTNLDENTDLVLRHSPVYYGPDLKDLSDSDRYWAIVSSKYAIVSMIDIQDDDINHISEETGISYHDVNIVFSYTLPDNFPNSIENELTKRKMFYIILPTIFDEANETITYHMALDEEYTITKQDFDILRFYILYYNYTSDE